METWRILHTNDLHSHFEHFPKIGRYLKKAQADTSVDEVYTFDAGDFVPIHLLMLLKVKPILN